MFVSWTQGLRGLSILLFSVCLATRAQAQLEFYEILQLVPVGADPVELVVFHNDGTFPAQDVAVVSQGTPEVRVFTMTSDAYIEETQVIPLTGLPSSITAATGGTCEFQRDLVVSSLDGDMQIFANGPGSTFVPYPTVPGVVPQSAGVAAFDFAGDGTLTIVAMADPFSFGSYGLATRSEDDDPGSGCGTYPGSQSSDPMGETPVKIGLSQITPSSSEQAILVLAAGATTVDPGRLDVYFYGGEIVADPPQGINVVPASYSPMVLGPDPVDFAVARLNGGQDDLVVAYGESSELDYYYYLSGDLLLCCTLGTGSTLETTCIAAGDIDGDGDDDVAVGVEDGVLIVVNEGGVFLSSPVYPLPATPIEMEMADLGVGANDGLELVMITDSNEMLILGEPPEDCDGDGTPDSVQLATGDCNDNGVLDVCEIAAGAADCNADGVLDLCQLTSQGWQDLPSPSLVPVPLYNDVAVFGDVAVAGNAEADLGSGPASGQAVVYRRQLDGTWVEEATLAPSSLVVNDRFGRAVAANDGLIAIGCEGRGSVFLFEYDGADWVAGPELAGFGDSVDLAPDRLVVGADFSPGPAALSIYERVGGAWALGGTFQDSTIGFGSQVAIEGDVALTVAGSQVRVFERGVTDWQEGDPLDVPLTPWDVDLSNGRIVAIGSQVLSAFSPSAGSWTLDQEFELAGFAVALDGDWAAVGESGPPYQVRLLRRVGGLWELASTIRPEVGGVPPTSDFGLGLDLHAGQLIASDAASTPDPRVRAFPVGDADCNDDGVLDECVSPLPTIDVPPSSESVCAFQPVTFSVVASSAGPLTYQWRFDGAPIPDAIDVNYTIDSVSTADVGEYSVEVGNECGATISPVATLLVYEETVIGSSPEDQVVCPGDSFTLEVFATGASLTYEWSLDGVVIPGATESTYSVTSAELDDLGAYQVFVDGLCGSLSSDSASVMLGGSCGFLRGDADGSGTVSIVDATSILFHLFATFDPPCDDALDVNDDGAVDVSDAVGLLEYLFVAGAPPVAPFPDCGVDPTADALSCDLSSCP